MKPGFLCLICKHIVESCRLHTTPHAYTSSWQKDKVRCCATPSSCKDDICLTNEYLLETTIPNNTLYLSLFNNRLVPNTLYMSPPLLCSMDTRPGLLSRLDSTTHPCYVSCLKPASVLTNSIKCKKK